MLSIMLTTGWVMAAFLSPVVIIPLVAIAVKAEEKNLMSKGWTREQIEERRRQNQSTFDEDDDGPLEREMTEYYRRENQRGTFPRDWAAEQDRAAYYRRENQQYRHGDRE